MIAIYALDATIYLVDEDSNLGEVTLRFLVDKTVALTFTS